MQANTTALLRVDEAHNAALCGQLTWRGVHLTFASRQLTGEQIHLRIDVGFTRLTAQVDRDAGCFSTQCFGADLDSVERDALRALAAAIANIIDVDGGPMRPGASLAFAASVWADEPSDAPMAEAVLV